MSGPFTDSIDPLALAVRGRIIEGSLPLAGMPRLQSLIGGRDNGGEVEFSLHFGRDEGRTANIQGVIKCVLVLECQRCMDKMDFSLESRIQLGLAISPEAVESLPGKYEPLLLSGDEITIASIIEDELIMALPAVAMHEIGDCPAGGRFLTAEQSASGENEETQVSGRKSPFAELAQLKEQLSTDSTNTDEE